MHAHCAALAPRPVGVVTRARVVTDSACHVQSGAFTNALARLIVALIARVASIRTKAQAQVAKDVLAALLVVLVWIARVLRLGFAVVSTVPRSLYLVSSSLFVFSRHRCLNIVTAACFPGRFITTNTATNETDCVKCPAGQYQPIRDRPSCLKCPAGKFQADDGLTFCDPCEPGRFSVLLGGKNNLSCALCPAGKHSIVAASQVCESCQDASIFCVGGRARTVRAGWWSFDSNWSAVGARVGQLPCGCAFVQGRTAGTVECGLRTHFCVQGERNPAARGSSVVNNAAVAPTNAAGPAAVVAQPFAYSFETNSLDGGAVQDIDTLDQQAITTFATCEPPSYCPVPEADVQCPGSVLKCDCPPDYECPAGTGVARRCGPGTIGELGFCKSCPAGQYARKCDSRISADVGTRLRLGCDQCHQCPKQTAAAQCDKGNLTLLPDYWFDWRRTELINADTQFYRCDVKGACNPQRTSDQFTTPSSSSRLQEASNHSSGWVVACSAAYRADGTTANTAHAGASTIASEDVHLVPNIKCQACAPGYGHDTNGVCHKCPDRASAIAVMVISVLAMAMLFFIFLRKALHPKVDKDVNGVLPSSPMATLRIAANYFYMVGLLDGFDLDWGSTLRRLFAVSSSVSGGTFTVVAPECMVTGTTFYETFIAYLCLPICGIVTIVVFLQLHTQWLKRQRHSDDSAQIVILRTTPTHVRRTAVLLFLYIM